MADSVTRSPRLWIMLGSVGVVILFTLAVLYADFLGAHLIPRSSLRAEVRALCGELRRQCTDPQKPADRQLTEICTAGAPLCRYRVPKVP